MIRYAIIEDPELIQQAVTHPKIWPWVTDDAYPDSRAWMPTVSPNVFHLGAWRMDDGKYLGLWQFSRRNAATWEVHTCLLPVAWGKTSTLAGRGAVVWFFVNVPQARRIVTCVPSDNPHALKLAERCGMTEWGRNPGAYLRRGVLHDEIWLGISKPVTTKLNSQVV